MIQPSRMPVIFIGHGNPMNALASNQYTDGWRALSSSMPKPRAILCVSAHWYVPKSAVTAMEPISFPVQGFEGGTISMLCVQVG